MFLLIWFEIVEKEDNDAWIRKSIQVVEEEEWDREVEHVPFRVGAAYVHNAEPKFNINQASPVFRLSVLNVGQIWFVKV